MLVQIVLLIAAMILAGVTGLSYLKLGTSARERHHRLQVFTIIGTMVSAIAVLSALNARGNIDLAWLFGAEDVDGGPIEYGTVLFFLFSSVISLIIGWKDQTYARIVYLALAVACFLVAGEELSWGQWLFHWATPQGLSNLNLQHETNLHNLVNPRLYDPVYAMAGLSLIGLAVMSVTPGPRAWVRERSSAFIWRDLSLFFDWLTDSRFGMVLTLCTAVLLQHESFEEYAECMLSLTLMLFLLYRLEMTHVASRKDATAAE